MEGQVQYLNMPFEGEINDKRSDFNAYILEGYMAKFGNVDWYDEVIVPGAFTETIEERGPQQIVQDADLGTARIKSKIKHLWQHWSDEPMGLPFVMQEDSIGLLSRVRISRTKDNDDRLEMVRDGTVDGLSIGFLTQKREIDDETGIRRLVKVMLIEHSSVTFPANEEALVVYAAKNQELMQAVKSVGEKNVLALAAKMKSSESQAMIETAVANLSMVLRHFENVEGGEVSTEQPTEPDDPEIVRQLRDFNDSFTLDQMVRKQRDRLNRIKEVSG